MARLGRTELDVYPLGLGGIPLMRLSQAGARAVIAAAVAGGINFADTAEGYGESESRLAAALQPDREGFIIASKSMERSAAGMSRAIDQSLARLNTGHVDIYQVHSIKDEAVLAAVLASGGALEALKDARDRGRVRFIGISGHRPAVLRAALETGEFDTVQVAINPVDREAEQDLLPYAKEHDIGIIAMKPVCGGTLDEPALGIRFCLNSAADVVLVGMKSATEVDENLQTARDFAPLSAAEEETLLFDVSQLGEQFCRQCGYCVPCPSSVPIPKILWLDNYHRRYGERDPWTEDDYRALPVNAAACQECGECEQKCPYDLPIRAMLKDAHGELRPSPVRLAGRGLRKVARRMRNDRPLA